MIYSSAVLSTHRAGKSLLGDAAEFVVERKIETSEPQDINEEFLKFELGLSASTPATSGAATPAVADEEKKAFARPKGPGRKR